MPNNEEQRISRNRKANISPKKVMGFSIVLIALLIIFLTLYDKYMPNLKEISQREFLGKSKNEIILIYEDNVLPNDSAKPLVVNGQVYLPVDFVKENVDKYIFWDEGARRLTITTANKVIHMKTDELTYYVNNKPLELNFPVYEENGTPYMPQSIIEEMYMVKLNYDEADNTVFLKFLDRQYKKGKILKAATMRYEPTIKSPIASKLLMGNEVFIYTEDMEEGLEFTRVTTENGITGFVKTESVGETFMTEAVKRETQKPLPPKKPIDGKVVMVWDQLENAKANENDERFVKHEGVNVLSPTWFAFNKETLSTDIINIADKEYVDWAHENGYQVWALVSDNFNKDISHAILAEAEARDSVMRQLLAFVATYGLDGINIDFEQVRKSDAEMYLQFIREFAPLLHEQGAVLSVDMYVPSPWSMYYNRAEVGKAADYICVMTYDEHYAGSETSGPVASIGFVEKGIKDTLRDVPRQKVIMGVPFYVRVWREEKVDGGEIKLSSRAVGMDYAYRIFNEKGAEFEWLPDKGLNYAEYTETEDGNEVTYKVWLEDEKSIEEKMKVAAELDIAGVAGWKRGLEKDGTWELISKYMGKIKK